MRDGVAATLWIPESLDVVILEVTQGRISVQDRERFSSALSERLGSPAIIVEGVRLEIRRIEG